MIDVVKSNDPMVDAVKPNDTLVDIVNTQTINIVNPKRNNG